MALSGSVTSGGGGSIFADSALSGSVSLRELSPDFFDSLRDEVLSGGFPDFVVGPNLTASLSGAFASEEAGSAFLATEGGALDDFVFADLGLREALTGNCAHDRALPAGFVLDLALAMA
jgi:hypothetical protein